MKTVLILQWCMFFVLFFKLVYTISEKSNTISVEGLHWSFRITSRVMVNVIGYLSRNPHSPKQGSKRDGPKIEENW